MRVRRVALAVSRQVGPERSYEEMQGDTGPGTGDPRPTWRQRLLLQTSRLLITAVLVGSAFLLLLGLSSLGVIGVTSRSTMSSVFSGVITGLFTLTSIVLTINQLVLSRVIASPDELEGRMDGTVEFRRRVERAAGVPESPIEPGAFVLLIADALCEHAANLREAIADAEADDGSEIETDTDTDAGRQAHEELTDYADTIDRRSTSLAENLDREGLDTFDVLKATAYVHFAADIRTGSRLEEKYGTDLPDATIEVLRETIDLLKTATVARQYVKTLYIQQDLARLSRHILYTGVSGLGATVLVALLYAGQGGPPVGPDALLLVVSAALALAFSPLAMLFSHAVQFAMIAVMTESSGPFTPKEELPNN
ncbi:hypothetical protein BRC77_06360 [Halobacteriales archaeon QH_8_64_26]|nr:MAG: hypothetical protein BRC77_06360 [Halobacteriales archaeon QH_8_64_26]